MNVKIITESIIIPKASEDRELVLLPGSSAASAVKILEEEGLTGSLTAEQVLDTHMLIRNSKHIKPEDELFDGDTLIIIKTLLGG